MNIILSMMLYGFFAGLKTAGSVHPESNRQNTWIGYSICLIILLGQIIRVGHGYGQMFWIIFALTAISGMFLTLSIFLEDKEMHDVISIIFFALAFVILRISALTILVGVALITLFYPMAMNYVERNYYVLKTPRSLIRIAVVFGLVAFWYFYSDTITFDVLDILNWIFDAL